MIDNMAFTKFDEPISGQSLHGLNDLRTVVCGENWD